MQTRELDGNTLRRMLCGGANEIRLHMDTINDLNVFPVPDGDTGTNMSKTIESGIAKITIREDPSLGDVAQDFAKGSLLGARGNSGVILSQFFAGVCQALSGKVRATPEELAEACLAGVKRSYAAVTTPVEGTILTVFRESAEYAKAHMNETGSVEDFLSLNIEEAERSLFRTKEILPALTEADVVDSGGAGYLCIIKGMYAALCGERSAPLPERKESDAAPPDYDLFTAESELTFGYCTECLVRLTRAKGDPAALDEKAFAAALTSAGCDSIVALKEGDILKVHAHTRVPSDVLTLCQKYGEFLNVKIENMSLQHSERKASAKAEPKTPPSLHKPYGIVTVATGDGLSFLFSDLGADIVINGGQTANPSAEQFLSAFASLNADHILLLPNNKNILLTGTQAAELWEGAPVTVIPTKTIPEGYAALSVFNASIRDPEEQVKDLCAAKDAVVSGEVTVAVRDSVIGGISIKAGEYIGILSGTIVTAMPSKTEALCAMIERIEDLSMREIVTLFVGEGVSEEERASVTETLEARFPELTVEVYIGGQAIYDYLVAVE